MRMRWVVRLVVLGVIAVVGRELHRRQLEIGTLAGEIDRERAAIVRAEETLDALDRTVGEMETRLGRLDAAIDAVEARHPRGIPRTEYPAYRRLVDERNALARRLEELVSRQRVAAGDYTRTVDRHNAGVEAVGAVARRGTPTAVVRDLWHRLLGAGTRD